MPDSLRLKPRRGKQATAESASLVLERGEIFFESPTTGVGSGRGRIKIGDGTTSYSSLPYFFNYSDFVMDLSNTAVTFTETSITNNTTLLNTIATGSNVNTIVAATKNLLSNLNTSVNALTNDLAAPYDSTHTYNTDAYCTYNNVLYRCLDDNVTGTWNSEKWLAVNITDEMGSGHVILNAAGTELAQEDYLQFGGYLVTTDDDTNGKTIVSDAPTEIDWDDWKDLSVEQKQGKKWLIVNAPDGAIDNNIITLRNQTLEFVNNVATIEYSYITDSSRVFTFYSNDTASIASAANILVTTTNGAVIFTAQNTPTGPITCDITIMGISSELSNFIIQKNVTFTYSTGNGWRSSIYNTNKRIVRAVSGDFMITGDGSDYCRIYQASDSGLTAISTASSPVVITCLVIKL